MRECTYTCFDSLDSYHKTMVLNFLQGQKELDTGEDKFVGFAWIGYRQPRVDQKPKNYKYSWCSAETVYDSDYVQVQKLKDVEKILEDLHRRGLIKKKINHGCKIPLYKMI